MEFNAQAIAAYLKGEIEGDPSATVTDISRIEEGRKGTLAFLANPKYTPYIYMTEASIVLVNKDLVLEKKVKPTLIRVSDAYRAFASLLDLYSQSIPQKEGIDANVAIDKTAEIGSHVYIGAFAFIGANAKIGENVKIYPQVYIGDNASVDDNTILYPGVKVYNNCKIGKNCIIHASTVIGSDGFGFATQDNKDFKKIPQIGNVVIEDNVEIGSNVSIDRATIGSTIIRKGAKLDNLIQIAHNVEIGENTGIAAQAGISGSTKVGRECLIAGQVGIVGHIKIADKVIIAAQSGVTNDVSKEGEILLGSPAYDIRENRRSIAIYKRLPELYKQVNDLERQLNKLRGG